MVTGPAWLSGFSLCLLGAVLRSSGEREAVGKRMGINKIKTGEREILYSHCPPAERERNMLECLLPSQKHIEMKVHKLFKKTTPAKLKGRRRRRGEKKKTSVGGDWKIF